MKPLKSVLDLENELLGFEFNSASGKVEKLRHLLVMQDASNTFLL